MQQYFTQTPSRSLTLSQRGLLGVAYGPHVAVWKDAFRTKQQSPYQTHLQAGTQIRNIAFVPYDDVLGIGHALGVSSIIVPGAGEPNFDTMEVNPYQTKKQRQESEVKSLLDKLPADMISLDPTKIGAVSRTDKESLEGSRRTAFEANLVGEKFDPTKHKARGRSSSQRRYLKKQGNVVDSKREAMRERLEEQKKERDASKLKKRQAGEEEVPKRTALDRFNRKKT
jgi:U3 small nucleolar RNA-associated protein 7